MSLPASVVQVPVVSGYVYRDATGSYPSGQVIFVPRTRSVVVDDETVTLPAELVATLDANGQFPAGFTLQTAGDGVFYTVIEDFEGGRTSFSILVLTTDLQINLATAAPATPPDDPVAQSAQASAISASNSATAAAASATAADTSAVAALGSQNAAATSATNAATSETNAATAATNAGNSATAAATSATNAGNSATAAANSATAAGTSATNAANSATASADSATAAAASAAQLAAWQEITQAAYDLLSPPDPATLYIVVG